MEEENLYRSSVSTLDDLIGVEDQIQCAYECLGYSQHCKKNGHFHNLVIKGYEGSGKTSFLNVVASEAAKRQHHKINFDPTDPKEEEDYYINILRNIERTTNDKCHSTKLSVHSVTLNFPLVAAEFTRDKARDKDWYAYFKKQIIEKVEKEKENGFKSIVLCIDEREIKNKELFWNVISNISRIDTDHFILLYIKSLKNPSEVTIYNSREVILNDFDYDNVKKYCDKKFKNSGIQIGHDVIEEILKITCGRPLLVEWICFIIYEEYKKRATKNILITLITDSVRHKLLAEIDMQRVEPKLRKHAKATIEKYLRASKLSRGAPFDTTINGVKKDNSPSKGFKKNYYRENKFEDDPQFMDYIAQMLPEIISQNMHCDTSITTNILAILPIIINQEGKSR